MTYYLAFWCLIMYYQKIQRYAHGQTKHAHYVFDHLVCNVHLQLMISRYQLVHVIAVEKAALV